MGFPNRVFGRDTRHSAVRRLAASLSLVGALLLCATALTLARAAENPPSLAVAGFFLVDTSGEQRDQTAEHDARLVRFDAIMQDELSQSGRFTLKQMTCPDPRCSGRSMTLAQLLASARETDARFLAIGAVEKMSTLVLWARLEVYDVASGQMVFNRLFTFRGDNDEAWRRAADYVARELIRNAPAG
ncbi:DUF2380 domain-containing protein [Pseudaminobacter salicylatoxidans]|uniref:DUF2380 domain-containing protein n=1 Tax=Pseudaminobacter salicylatoxidans TaxID=93369 RepID=UPI0002DDCFF3|nr:DUF2380 domain-containing protein [Pseudaminobacter salicylatoxidans]